MSEKFTKGPWTATYDSQLRALIEIYSIEDRILVAVLPDRGTVEAMPEIESNANLIAAAPDMYEALEFQCKNCLGRYSISKDSNECALYIRGECMIAKALRKARGEEE